MHGTVLRPVSGTGLNFAGGTKLRRIAQSQPSTDGLRITGRARQPDSQPRLRVCVVKQLRLLPVLAHQQINPAVAVVIRDGRTALLPVYPHAALGRAQGGETAMSIAAQPQAQAGIETWRLGLQGEEILREENVLVAVSVEITDADTKRRCSLRQHGQRAGDEVGAAIEENGCLQPGGFQNFRRAQPFAENLLHAGPAVRSVSRKFSGQERHGPRHKVQPSLRHDFLQPGVKVGFDDLRGTIPREFAVINSQRLRAMRLVAGVTAPV